MINRLRSIANRPVRELPAGLVLAMCALVIALGAIGVAQIADPQPGREPRPGPRTDETQPTSSEVTNPASSDWDQGYSELPSPDDPEPALDTARDGAEVRDASRRFMTGYLAFTYGHARASEIQAASPEMIRGLAQHPPRVRDRVRRLHPRVTLVQQVATGPIRGVAVAVVDDGATRYSVHVGLIRNSPDDWIVTEVTGP